eukprot:7239119-Pyramimonas_sp.AAC.1
MAHKKGNALADKWVKRGARLWNVSQDHLDCVSGCERIASDIVKWQSRCQEVVGELEQPDGRDLVGTADAVLGADAPPGLIQACLEEGVAPFQDRSLAEGVAFPNPAPSLHPPPTVTGSAEPGE